MSSKRNILWVTPKWPLPANDGARRATFNLVSELAKQGEVIDLVALVARDEVVDVDSARRELNVRHVYVIRRPVSRKNGLGLALCRLWSLCRQPLLPITMSSYATRQVGRAFDAVLTRTFEPLSNVEVSEGADSVASDWDFVVYDGLHAAAHSTMHGLFVRPRNAKRIIYRAHNCEAAIWKSKIKQTPNPVSRLLLRFQAKRVDFFEDSLASVAEGVAPVSADDLCCFQTVAPRAHTQVVRIGHEFNGVAPAPRSRSMTILYLGRLDWQPNRDGLQWFLDRVWPRARACRSDLQLLIAGSGRAQWLEARLPQEGVNFVGEVDDLSEVYAKAHLCLVPVFYGSGTRVKAIEASCHARPCLSTEFGVEGLGLKPNRDYFCAETEDEWVKQLLCLESDQAEQIGKRAYDRLKTEFSVAESANRFRELIVAAHQEAVNFDEKVESKACSC